jgi:hypothetical protein
MSRNEPARIAFMPTPGTIQECIREQHGRHGTGVNATTTLLEKA